MSLAETAMPNERIDDGRIAIEILDEEQKRYLELANLKKAEVTKEQAEELWHICRSLAVLDWAMLQPDKPAGDFEERWRTIMRKVHQVALEVLDGNNGHKHKPN